MREKIIEMEEYAKEHNVPIIEKESIAFIIKFIKANNIKCLEGLPGEDTYFTMHAFLCANKIYYIPNIIYYYRQRNVKDKSASTSWNCSKKFFVGQNEAYRRTYQLFLEKKQLQFYRFLYARNMTYLLYRFI